MCICNPCTISSYSLVGVEFCAMPSNHSNNTRHHSIDKVPRINSFPVSKMGNRRIAGMLMADLDNTLMLYFQ